MIATLFSTIGNIDALAAMGATIQAFVSIGLRMAVMICIIAMGALLLEYAHKMPLAAGIVGIAAGSGAVLDPLRIVSAPVNLINILDRIRITVYAILAGELLALIEPEPRPCRHIYTMLIC